MSGGAKKGASAGWPQGLEHAGRTSGAERGAGTPLPDTLRASMEQSLGGDFSDVRVHTNSAVAQANQSLNARAFTVGTDIYFRPGEYNPASQDGKMLIAHELSHVVQQSTGRVKQN